MAQSLDAFPSVGAPRRSFLLAVSVMIALTAIGGFWATYFAPLLAGRSEAPGILHLHAFVYVAWVGLFVAQVAFVAAGRVDLHRRVGRYGIAWGFVVLVVGLWTTVDRFADRVAEGVPEQAAAIMVWPLLDMVLFAAFFGLAVRHRPRPELHRRLMLVAMVPLLIAPVARLVTVEPPSAGSWFLSDSVFAHGWFVLVWLAPLLLAAGYDLIRRRELHPVYLSGILVLALSTFRDQLVGGAAWTAFADWLAAMVS